MPKMLKKTKKANHPHGATPKNATTKVLWPGLKRVGGGGPPQGVTIRRPPKVCRACWTNIMNFNIKHQTPTSNGLSTSVSEIFMFPLSIISPQARPVHRKPAAKKRKSLVFSHFWSFFSPSETRFKNDFEKTSKKLRKSRILASQNGPQTLPKSSPNRRSKKTAFFHSFFI